MQCLIYYFDPGISTLFHDIEDKNGHIQHSIQSPINFCCAQSVIAGLLEAESIEAARTKLEGKRAFHHIEEFRGFPSDSSIGFNEADQAYISLAYGYIVKDRTDGHFKVLPPVYISEDKMKAVFMLYAGRQELIPGPETVQAVAASAGIANLIVTPELKKILSEQTVDSHKIHPVLIAQGKKPQDGMTEYYDFIAQDETSVGTLHSDGKIDYRERQSFIPVQAGQAVLVRHPEIKAIDGCDVQGNVVPARHNTHPSIKPGTGVRQSSSDTCVYESTLGGVIQIKDDTLSIDPLLNINGDVSYETGHIDFDGSVNIKGAVLSGFRVKASGDIIVDNDVEDATLIASGAVTVKMGITGSGKSHIIAGSDVYAEFIMNSRLETMGKLTVNESIINSQVVSNDSVTVVAKRGQIIGGHTTALNEIEVKISGSHKESETILEVGKSLLMEKELEEYSSAYTSLDSRKQDIHQKIHLTYGEHLIKPVMEEIEKLLPAQQKDYLALMKELMELDHKIKEAEEKIEEIKKKYNRRNKAEIRIQDKALPGTIIRIHDKQLPLTEEMSFVRFYLEEKTQSIDSGPLH